MPERIRTDVLVVGSGPAGSTAARFAAESGVRVTFVEGRAEVGTPVRCGELVPSDDEIRGMFPAATDIASLFDMPGNLRVREIEGIGLTDPKGRRTLLDFTGYSTDRDRFDNYLASEAVKAGAELFKGCQFKGVKGGLAETTAGEIEYKVIIGADGPGSRVAKALGLPKNMHPYPAVTAQAEGDFDPYVEMFFGGIAPGAYGWIIPKAGRANVGVGFSPKFADGTLGEYFETFKGRHNLNTISEMHGKYVPSEGMVSRVVTDDGMIVGDAAGHVISVNGGGIPLAVIGGRACGQVAGDHLRKGRPLSDYQRECEKIFRRPLDTAAKNKRLADAFAFRSEFSTAACMKLLGKRRMGNLIRCKRIFP
ncbi:MAG: NAD(P)/FAD-dependent oxidoreductase [Candidatus Methanoplasma sp.]|jgi:digeranylgeranylglycerophospholipid reductase|nr:NAD(P)/FAD-dependent oxidoreductase [Candidatus Methanoplasma sp.]